MAFTACTLLVHNLFSLIAVFQTFDFFFCHKIPSFCKQDLRKIDFVFQFHPV